MYDLYAWAAASAVSVTVVIAVISHFILSLVKKELETHRLTNARKKMLVLVVLDRKEEKNKTLI